jgi:hypothetical protein
VFPVRYGLDFYILFGRNSVFKGLRLGLQRQGGMNHIGQGPVAGSCEHRVNLVFHENQGTSER